MTPDHRDYLQDILTSFKKALEFTEGMTFEEFSRDRKTINAVIRSLEVLGEAAKQIPDSLRTKAANVPWRRMAAMRDKLIHAYFGVDLGIVWKVIREELPPLQPEIRGLLTELDVTEYGMD